MLPMNETKLSQSVDFLQHEIQTLAPLLSAIGEMVDCTRDLPLDRRLLYVTELTGQFKGCDSNAAISQEGWLSTVMLESMRCRSSVASRNSNVYVATLSKNNFS